MIKNICVLCNNSFSGWGNNPEPIKSFAEGKCCDDCNIKKVIPKRIEEMVFLTNKKD